MSILEQKGMIVILLSLLDYTSEKPANMTELKKKTGLHNQTIEAKVELLKQMSFVEDKKEKVVPCERKVWLTERGHKLANILAQGESVLRQR